MSLFFFQPYPKQNKAAETAVRKEMLRKRQSKICQTGSTYLLTPKTKYGSAKELQFLCTCAGELNGDVALTGDLIERLVERIVVYGPRKIEVYFKFRNEFGEVNKDG